MAELDKDIAAFENLRAEMESHHHGKWVLFHDEKLIEVFDSLEAAASEAVASFGRGPYLIRQVGTPDLVMPASVMYRTVTEHA